MAYARGESTLKYLSTDIREHTSFAAYMAIYASAVAYFASTVAQATQYANVTFYSANRPEWRCHDNRCKWSIMAEEKRQIRNRIAIVAAMAASSEIFSLLQDLEAEAWGRLTLRPF